jgi:hypothetical protein
MLLGGWIFAFSFPVGLIWLIAGGLSGLFIAAVAPAPAQPQSSSDAPPRQRATSAVTSPLRGRAGRLSPGAEPAFPVTASHGGSGGRAIPWNRSLMQEQPVADRQLLDRSGGRRATPMLHPLGIVPKPGRRVAWGTPAA